MGTGRGDGDGDGGVAWRLGGGSPRRAVRRLIRPGRSAPPGGRTGWSIARAELAESEPPAPSGETKKTDSATMQPLSRRPGASQTGKCLELAHKQALFLTGLRIQSPRSISMARLRERLATS